MLDQISEDIKSAMKARDKVRLEALRYVKKLLIENKTAKAPKAEFDIVVGYAKQLKDSLGTMPADSELFAKTEEEIRILEEYLPSQLNEDDVRGIIKDIIAELEVPNLGAVMKQLSPQIKGRFDGKKASDMVREMV